MTVLWNGKQMWLLWKCNQTAFEVLRRRSVFANQETPNPRKQMLVCFGSKHLFHRKLLGLIFTLVTIKILNLSGEFSSTMRFWVTAPIHSKLGSVVIAFDVCSLAFLPLLTPVAGNYPGRLPTTMGTIASVTAASVVAEAADAAKGYNESQGNFPGFAQLKCVVFLLQCVSTITVWGGNSISELQGIPRLPLLWSQWFLILQGCSWGFREVE